ncbi:hypothetical protein EBS40_02290 [bacterium]|nr:hypothetical protein [bacterium]
MTIIIIADSFNKGMKSQGCVGLLPFNKKTNLFQQQYNAIRSVYPKAKIVYIYGFEAKKFTYFIRSFPSTNLATILNNKYNIYNHGYGLSLVRDYIVEADECLVLLGYEPIQVSQIKNLYKLKRSAALISHNKTSNIGCIIQKDTNEITNIFYGLPNSINNIYFLKKPELNILANILNSNNAYNMFLFETINAILSQNGKIGVVNT